MARRTAASPPSKPKARSGGGARKKRLEEKIASEEAEFAGDQQRLAEAQEAAERITASLQVRAGRVSALREELESG